MKLRKTVKVDLISLGNNQNGEVSPLREFIDTTWLWESDSSLGKPIPFQEPPYSLHFPLFLYGKSKMVSTPTHYFFSSSEDCSALFRASPMIKILFCIFPDNEWNRRLLMWLPGALTFTFSAYRQVVSEGGSLVSSVMPWDSPVSPAAAPDRSYKRS